MLCQSGNRRRAYLHSNGEFGLCIREIAPRRCRSHEEARRKFPPSLANRLVWTFFGWILLLGAIGAAQTPGGVPSSLSDLPRMKTFTAYRVSSNNRFVGSNDDSKRIS